MTYTSATRLIKCDLQKKQEKWMDFIDGGKGYLFGIPSNAHKVVQFKVEEKSIKEIGPDLGNEQWKYKNGVKAGNGSIYCLPHYAKYILKITPRDGQDADVQVLKDKQLPIGRWGNGALAKDGCIYYFPCNGKRILRLDPNKGDSLSLVGREIRNGFAAVVSAVDGCIYGISSRRVIKYNPVKKRVSQVGKDFDGHHFFDGAVLAENGNIYSANLYGQMLQVDTANNDWKIIGKRVHNGKGRGWGRPVLGADKCIYFPPACHAPSCNDRVLKFNPSSHTVSLIGDFCEGNQWKWNGAALASDGYIYYIPYNSDYILQIDSRNTTEQILELIMNDYAGHEHVDEDNLYVDQYIGIETLDEQKLFTWPLNFNT